MRLPLLVALRAAAVATLAVQAAGAVTVGIVVPEGAPEPAARAAAAAQAAAEDRGWTVRVGEGGAAPGPAIATLVRARVDALVLAMIRPEAHAAELEAARAAGVPIVTVLAGPSPLARLDVTVNEYVVGADGGAYLLGLLGRQGGRAVLLRADDGEGAEPGAKARASVVALMLEEAPPGVRSVATVRRDGGDWQEALRREVDAALGQPVEPGLLAVWSATDELALAAEAALKARGLTRERAAVVGTGGSRSALARLRDPAGLLAATVAIPYELLGQAAVDVLDDMLAGAAVERAGAGPYLLVDPVVIDRTTVPLAEDELPW